MTSNIFNSFQYIIFNLYETIPLLPFQLRKNFSFVIENDVHWLKSVGV